MRIKSVKASDRVLCGGRHGVDYDHVKKTEDNQQDEIKGSIHEYELNDYIVTISFAGYVGSDNDYNVSAINEDEACDDAIEIAKSDLSVEDWAEIDDGEWEVTVSFAGQLGTEETYTVSADNEDEACDAAIEEASWDLNVESVELDEI